MDVYKRKNARKNRPSIDSRSILALIPYWILSLICAFGLFFIAAVVYMFTPLPQTALPAVSRTAVIIAEIAVAFMAGKISRQPGIITGLLFGLGFSLIFMLVGLFTGSISIISIEFWLMLITGVLVGIFGGIIGNSMAPKRSRGRNYYV